MYNVQFLKIAVLPISSFVWPRPHFLAVLLEVLIVYTTWNWLNLIKQWRQTHVRRLKVECTTILCWKKKLLKRIFFSLKNDNWKENVSYKASRETHIPENFIRPTVTWFYYCTWHTPPSSVELGRIFQKILSGLLWPGFIIAPDIHPHHQLS